MSKNHINPASVSYRHTQNYLTSEKTIKKLLHLTNICGNDTVVEIGAGKGHITKALLQKSNMVIASEIDRTLYKALNKKFENQKRLSLLNTDFLKTRLPQSEYKVFSNIPFSISTDIVRKLTQSENPPSDAWLVMEKGAAKRFCGKPAENLNSLLLKPFFDLKTVYHFKREDFHPKPGVDVVLLYIQRKEVPDIPRSEQHEYRRFVSNSFKYGLFGRNALLTKNQIYSSLRQSKLEPVKQGGDILYIQWLCLFRSWLRYKKHN